MSHQANEMSNTSTQLTFNDRGNNTVNQTLDVNVSQPLDFNQADSEVYARIIKEIIIPSVFIFGIVGNIINLLVLSQKRMKRNMSCVEKSATLGLMNLALSDFMFCFVGSITLVLNKHGSGSSALDVFRFYYEIYKRPLLNIFLFSSTWLITLVSGERFVGVCFPYRACTMIKVPRTMLVHSIVFVVAIIVNLPLFFKFRIVRVPCYSTYQCYTIEPWWFLFQDTLARMHLIFWLTLGTFIPLIILLFCNASILKSVVQLRHTPASSVSNEHLALIRLTWILLSMVLLFLVLICPSMIIEMLHQTGFHNNMVHGTLAVTITNLMQAVKFSANFLLYCGLHVKFRNILFCRIPIRYWSRLSSREGSTKIGEALTDSNRRQNNEDLGKRKTIPSAHCHNEAERMVLK